MSALLRVEIPMRLPSVANLREHWAAKAKRVKAHRHSVWAFVGRNLGTSLAIAALLEGSPLIVKLTRIGPRKLDSDNLSSAFKAVRDQVAAELGIDDGSDAIEWRYGQEKGPAAIRIEIARSAQPVVMVLP